MVAIKVSKYAFGPEKLNDKERNLARLAKELPPKSLCGVFVQRSLHSLLLLLTIFHLRLGELSLNAVLCQKGGGGGAGEGKMVLRVDPRIVCYSAQHLADACVAWFLFIFYYCLFPLLVFLRLRRVFAVNHPELLQLPRLNYFPYPKTPRQRLQSDIHESYDFLIKSFRPRFYPLAFVPFVANYIILIASTLSNLIATSLFVAGLQFAAEFILTAIFKPLDEASANFSDLFIKLLKIIVIAVFMYMAVWVMEAPAATLGSSAGKKPSEIPLNIFYLYSYFALTGLCLLFLFLMLKKYIGIFISKWAKRIVRAQERLLVFINTHCCLAIAGRVDRWLLQAALRRARNAEERRRKAAERQARAEDLRRRRAEELTAKERAELLEAEDEEDLHGQLHDKTEDSAVEKFMRKNDINVMALMESKKKKNKNKKKNSAQPSMAQLRARKRWKSAISLVLTVLKSSHFEQLAQNYEFRRDKLQMGERIREQHKKLVNYTLQEHKQKFGNTDMKESEEGLLLALRVLQQQMDASRALAEQKLMRKHLQIVEEQRKDQLLGTLVVQFDLTQITWVSSSRMKKDFVLPLREYCMSARSSSSPYSLCLMVTLGFTGTDLGTLRRYSPLVRIDNAPEHDKPMLLVAGGSSSALHKAATLCKREGAFVVGDNLPLEVCLAVKNSKLSMVALELQLLDKAQASAVEAASSFWGDEKTAFTRGFDTFNSNNPLVGKGAVVTLASWRKSLKFIRQKDGGTLKLKALSMTRDGFPVAEGPFVMQLVPTMSFQESMRNQAAVGANQLELLRALQKDSNWQE